MWVFNQIKPIQKLKKYNLIGFYYTEIIWFIGILLFKLKKKVKNTIFHIIYIM